MNYKKITTFSEHEIKDTTNMACGFDYKLTSPINYYCVEVKGLNTNSGGISMTEKEFLIASNLKEKYCLFIVKNFRDKPTHDIILNPVNSQLKFQQTQRQIIQTNFITNI